MAFIRGKLIKKAARISLVRLIFPLVSISACFLPAAAMEYGLDTWTTANGLPQNTVTGVAQTPDGYLWLSTFDGLARFDGVRFTVFDKGNSKGIVNNRFAGIYADPQGVVWAVTENGAVTVYRNGAFASYQMKQATDGAISIGRDAVGRALFETDGGSFYLNDGEFTAVDNFTGIGVRRIYYGSSGSRWSFTAKDATQVRDGVTTVYPLAFPNEVLIQTGSRPLHEDRQGALWVMLKDRLYRLSDGRIYSYSQNDIPEFSTHAPQLVFDDPDGSVWIVFCDLSPARKSNAKFVRFRNDRFAAHDLGEPIVTTRGLADREGNFWLASPNGLRRIRKKLITTISAANGLNSDEVYPLLEMADGSVLVGTVQGVNRVRQGVIEDLNVRYSAGFPLYMRGLWQDGSGTVWLGYQGEGGFGRLQPPSTVARVGKDDMPNGATDFAADDEENVWIATEKGLLKYKNQTEVARYTIADGLISDKIITLRFDRSGNLWLGTYDGLSMFRNGQFTNFAGIEGSPRGFVRAIYEDSDGVIWFGTYGDGLVRYKDGQFFNYRVEHGLFNNGVFAILDDNRGSFWMSSNRGIHRVRKQELNDLADGRIPKLSGVGYDEKDGMSNVECNGGRIPAAIRTRDGKLWFATMGGVAIVDPEVDDTSPVPPVAVIVSVSIDRKPAIRDPRSEIEIEPGQSTVAIEYTGLSLKRSAQIQFRYMLEGLEDTWIEAGTKRTVDYSYLPAGSYTFRLVAGNADRVWGAESAVLRIYVRPYFYQTWWFRLLAILLVAIVIGTFFYSRVARLRAIADAKGMFSRQLIESQEAERKRIAVELHDGLGQNLVVIKNRAMLGLSKGDDPERVARELRNISDSASEALDEVREITNNLRPQLLDSLGLTRAIGSMLKKMAGVIEIRSDIDPIDGVFTESQEISIYRIIQESLGNVVKHSDASEATVRIKRDAGTVTISIEDNGRGFDQAGVTSGLGLVGMTERARILGTGIAITSRLGDGTRVEVRIDVAERE